MKKEISVVAILVLFAVSVFSGLFVPIAIGRDIYEDISDEYEALYKGEG